MGKEMSPGRWREQLRPQEQIPHRKLTIDNCADDWRMSSCSSIPLGTVRHAIPNWQGRGIGKVLALAISQVVAKSLAADKKVGICS